MTRHFIILSGEAGAGKDSVADILVDRHGYRKVMLSDEMKRFAGRVFGFTDEQLYGPSTMRNEPDPRWARPCPDCRGLGLTQLAEPGAPSSARLCKTCDGMGKINDNSPRRVLQLLGDEWGRQLIHPDIWTMSSRPMLEDLVAQGTRIVINDARFENDRANLASWFSGACVDVRTTRDRGSRREAWRLHASELSRPATEQLQHVIHNDEAWPFPSLSRLVDEMLLSLYDEA